MDFDITTENWKVVEGTTKDQWNVVDDSKHKIVSVTHGYPKEIAKLIAALPELYEATVMMRDGFLNENNAANFGFLREWNAANKALDKATK